MENFKYCWFLKIGQILKMIVNLINHLTIYSSMNIHRYTTIVFSIKVIKIQVVNVKMIEKCNDVVVEGKKL